MCYKQISKKMNFLLVGLKIAKIQYFAKKIENNTQILQAIKKPDQLSIQTANCGSFWGNEIRFGLNGELRFCTASNEVAQNTNEAEQIHVGPAG